MEGYSGPENIHSVLWYNETKSWTVRLKSNTEFGNVTPARKNVFRETTHLWREVVCVLNKGYVVEDHVCQQKTVESFRASLLCSSRKSIHGANKELHPQQTVCKIEN
jgi:hypothetical protein